MISHLTVDILSFLGTHNTFLSLVPKSQNCNGLVFMFIGTTFHYLWMRILGFYKLKEFHKVIKICISRSMPSASQYVTFE